MPPIRDFRSLSDRVEVDFHRRGNRFTRRLWWWSLGLGLLALLACCLPMARGQHAFYAAGTVSKAHKMFEHDCAQCHQDWTLLARLNPFSNAKITSVKNEQCLACHPGEAHHANQVPAHGDGHAELSCADCHREHRGNEQLANLSDQLCQQCHLDLGTHGGSERFAHAIDRFDNAGAGGHPEFALDRLLKRDSQQGAGSESLSAAWAKYNQAPSDPANPDDRGLRQQEGVFVDRGRIQFNHKVHLAETLPGVDRKPLSGDAVAEFRENCRACHEPDETGRYMRPIRYEQHCQSCHPLYFDSARFPGEVVPHREPNTVLGWLLQRYALGPSSDQGSAGPARRRRSPAVLSEGLEDDDAAPLLGDGEGLEKEAAAAAAQDAERLLGALPAPLLPETTSRAVQGGCRYCHQVEPGTAGSAFAIVPPRIPERWSLHSEFDHGSHTMLTCHQCHGRRGPQGTLEPVSTSSLTEDVLLPGIENCRECHASSPGVTSGATGVRINGAGHLCVECHVYHAPPDPEWNRGSGKATDSATAAGQPQKGQDSIESGNTAKTEADNNSGKRTPSSRRNSRWQPTSRFSESSR
ncbi:MAG: cytochrome c3 family protein [Planctomycetaceae bacterium]